MKNKITICIIGLLLLAGCNGKAEINNNELTQKDIIAIILNDLDIQEDDVSNLIIERKAFEDDYSYEVSFDYDAYSFTYKLGSNGKIYRSDRISKIINNEIKNDLEFKEEDALKVALKHAGVLEEDAMLLKIERDYDDHEVYFEVEFRTPESDYEYEISNKGEILESSREKHTGSGIVYSRPTYYYTGASRYYYSGATEEIDLSKAISEDEAIRIALSHAGLKKEDVQLRKVQRDNNEYDIDFHTSEYKFEYDISLNGTIKSSKKKLR